MAVAVTIIWVVFAAVFTSLGFYYLSEASRRIPDFSARERLSGGAQIDVMGVPLDQPLLQFIAEVNAFIHSFNASSTRQNMRNSIGYFIAAATSLFSAVLANADTISRAIAPR